ncbi:MAG: glycosyltransferase family 39 protein [Bacteroidetes bacterium]|nr:glycosyltransferase family 39 protein [Bacteroidota bacterium]
MVIKKDYLILTAFVVLKFLLHYMLIGSMYDLHRDEYLHLDQAHHLAWGYQSVPPVTSWISSIIFWMGGSAFWVKFFPGLFGAITMIVVWDAVRELGGDLYAKVLGATCILFSVVLRLNLLYQPNSLDVLCWTGFYYLLVRYINSGNPKWIYAGAIVFSIGFLNKYNIVFLAAGLLPAILLTPQRGMLLRRDLYLAALVALMIVAPNLIWQYRNNFPVMVHLNELTNKQLVNVDRIGFIKSQVLFFIGSIIVIFAALYALIFHKPFQSYRFFIWSLLFTMGIFLFLRAKDYYAVGIYPIYLAFGSVYISSILQEGWRKYLRGVVLALPLLLFIPISSIAFLDKSPEYIIEHAERFRRIGLLRWEDGKEHTLPQDYADMLGWKELAQTVDKVYHTFNDSAHVLVLCDNYGEAGAINYYSSIKNINCGSFSADYRDWFQLDKRIETIIHVKERNLTRSELERANSMFDTVYLASSRISRFAREDTIRVYIFNGAKVDVNEVIRREVGRR